MASRFRISDLEAWGGQTSYNRDSGGFKPPGAFRVCRSLEGYVCLGLQVFGRRACNPTAKFSGCFRIRAFATCMSGAA